MSGRCETDGDTVVVEYNWLKRSSGWGLSAEDWVGEDYKQNKIIFTSGWNTISNFIYNINSSGRLNISLCVKKLIYSGFSWQHVTVTWAPAVISGSLTQYFLFKTVKQTNIRQHKATSATELNSIKTTHSITSHSVGPKKMKNSVFVCSPQKLIYGASRQNSVAAFSWRTEPAGGPKTNKMAPHSSAALRKTSRKSPPTFMIFANAPVWWFLPTECECLS